MKKNLLRIFLMLFTTALFAQANKVEIVKNTDGTKLVVDGRDFMINGMNWDYVPIGTDVTNANFYKQSDDVCPEVYNNTRFGYPLYNVGWYEEQCNYGKSLESLATILIDFTKWNSNRK